MRKAIPSEMGDDKDRNFVTALARGLDILRCFGPADEYLGNAELAKRTNIPRPTVSRMTATLTQLGYLRYVSHLEKYRLGPGVLELGYRYLASEGVRELARPFMQELADATDCMVAMAAVDGTKVNYIQVCQGNGPMVLRLAAGSQVPMATTALGRVYLAATHEHDRNQRLAKLEEEYGRDWPEVLRGIERGFEDYQKYGFCISDGEWNRDVSGVAVPMFVDGGEHILPMNIGGSALRLTRRILVENLGPRLKELVDQVSALSQGSMSS
ncbi:IclR family transcriptional regulator [Isoalcanivorax beigongshangi]|uniref:IclR family transcriptional regulator n=1 Tax=Isoalcanivorax beigongshangi TaxID=3238810 RepID=A0ABV4AJW3_9GAMM